MLFLLMLLQPAHAQETTQTLKIDVSVKVLNKQRHVEVLESFQDLNLTLGQKNSFQAQQMRIEIHPKFNEGRDVVLEYKISNGKNLLTTGNARVRVGQKTLFMNAPTQNGSIVDLKIFLSRPKAKAVKLANLL